MKKIILKLLTTVAYYASCAGLGWILGKIAGLLMNKIVTEDMIEKHPKLSILLIVAIFFLICIAPVFPLVMVMTIGKGKIEEKIDDADWD